MKPEIIIMLTHHDVTVKDAGRYSSSARICR